MGEEPKPSIKLPIIVWTIIGLLGGLFSAFSEALVYGEDLWIRNTIGGLFFGLLIGCFMATLIRINFWAKEPTRKAGREHKTKFTKESTIFFFILIVGIVLIVLWFLIGEIIT